MQKKVKILFLDRIPEEIHNIYRSFLPDWAEYITTTNSNELPSLAKEADVFMLGGYKVTKEVIDWAPHLKLIHLQGVGYEKIDVEYATNKGIHVCVTPAGTVEAVAEHTIMFMLSLMRHLTEINADMHCGKYPRWDYRCHSYNLEGKTVGFIGFGRIGQETAKRLHAFHTRIQFYDPYVQAPGLDFECIKVDSLKELARTSDIISVHLPLNTLTKGLCNEDNIFAHMKETAFFVNTARGGVVDHNALYHALSQGRIAGAASDVYCNEALSPSDRFLLLPNFILTPHIASGTRDTHIARGRHMFENVRRLYNQEPLLGCINQQRINKG